MSESRPAGLSLRRSGAHLHGRVTMIESGTKLSSVRRSKIAFWAVGSTVGLSACIIASAIVSFPTAVGVGLLTGLLVGFTVGVGLFCWPAIRVGWHWAAEIIVLAGFLASYRTLTDVMPWWAAVAILAALVGLPSLVPAARRRAWPWLTCAVSRHRLRVCFHAFVASAGKGMSPLILLARPMPAGERVWIWLRPGLALGDLEQRLDRIAAGCWAAECRIAPASRRFSALLRLDIIRRNPLAGSIGSPLPGLVPDTIIDAAPLPAAPAPAGLDLPDTFIHALTEPVEPKRRIKAFSAAPAAPEPAQATNLPAPQRGGEDLSDWI